MIAKDDAFIVTIDEKKRLTNAEKEVILNSDIIISDVSLEKSEIATVLQNYKGTYLNSGKAEIVKGILSEKDEIDHILNIRDAFSEINPNKRGAYYDNAGTYIHLLDDTYTKLRERIQAYNQQSFIIVGQNLDNFLTDFGLQKHNSWTVSTEGKTNRAILDEIEAILQAKKVWIVFVDPDVSRDIITKLKEKTQIQVYTLITLEEDTSGWGYIRYIEKMINIFVSAFDTYD